MVESTFQASFQADHDVASASHDVSYGMATLFRIAMVRTIQPARLATTRASQATSVRLLESDRGPFMDTEARIPGGARRSRRIWPTYQSRDSAARVGGRRRPTRESASAERPPQRPGSGRLAVHEDAGAVQAPGEPEDRGDGEEQEQDRDREIDRAGSAERKAGEHQVRREQRDERQDDDERRVDRDEARARVRGDEVARDRHEGERRDDLVDLLLAAHERGGA